MGVTDILLLLAVVGYSARVLFFRKKKSCCGNCAGCGGCGRK